jgi:hypothetical protein
VTNRYETPEAFRQALEDRLRKAAEGEGSELGRRRQLLVLDRFLARVGHEFGETAILKGGLAIELRLERARTTRDVDLRLTGSPEEVLLRLQEAGRLNLGDFLNFEIQPSQRKAQIEAAGMRYQGLRYRSEARLAGKVYGAPFGVDVAFAEPIQGEPDLLSGSDLLAFAGIRPSAIRVYPLESHVAEKLHAYTLPRDRENTRAKDLPDLALLATVRIVEADALRRAIRQTFDHRATHAVPESLPKPPTAWERIYARMALEDGFVWKTLADVFEASRGFLDPVLAGARGRWHPDSWQWSKSDS